MRVRRKTLWAKIDSKGVLNAYWGEIEAFCKMHPGKNAIIRVEIQRTEPSQKLTDYFFGYVVKEMQRAFYDAGESLTESQTYDTIRKNCPLFIEEKRENGQWTSRLKEWEELDSAEAVDIVSWVQQWASENYWRVIDDPI